MKAAAGAAWMCWAAAALVGPGLRAEDDGLSVAFKVRAGLQVASVQDGLSNHMLGMGLEVGFPLVQGRLYAELGYQFKPGVQYRADLAGMARATPATTIDPVYSVDSVKNKLDGAFLRLGYGAELNPSWGWKAGLQLGGGKFSNQSLGFVTDGQINDSGGLDNATYLDTYASTNSKTTVAISPFCAVSWHLDQYSSFEFGVLLLNYKTYIHEHVAGSVVYDPESADPYVWGGHTGADGYRQSNRLVPHLEVSYVFHF